MEYEDMPQRSFAIVTMPTLARQVAAVVMRTAVLVALATGASACGNKGPLYFPDQDAEKKKKAALSIPVESIQRT